MLCLSTSFLLLYINIFLIVLREHSFLPSDSIEYIITIPMRMPTTSLSKANRTIAMSSYKVGAIPSVEKTVQSINSTASREQLQNPGAYGKNEFVSKPHAKKMYLKLMERRNAQLDAYIKKMCRNNSGFSPCSYMNRVSSIIKKRNSAEVSTHFDKLRYTPKGTICEGCSAKINTRFLLKPPQDDLIVRKFVGNIETNEIYTVDNRIVLFRSI